MKFAARFAAALLATGLMAGAAAAAQVTGTLSFASEQGDYIGQGQTASYSEGLSVQGSTDNSYVNVRVRPADWSYWWDLSLKAPNGEPLKVGVYEGATRYPFNASTVPGLSFSGSGRGCNTLTGRFEILDIAHGPHGYIERLHAVFEQHCEGGTPALFGEVNISQPPAPEALSISVALDDKGMVKKATGQATVGGTVTCSQPTTAYVNGTLNQRLNRFAMASGSYYTQVACGPEPTRFSVVVNPGQTPFGNGQAAIDAHAWAYDPTYGGTATADQSGVVQLSIVKK